MMRRLSPALAPALLLVFSFAACGGKQPRSRLAPDPNDAVVTLECEARDVEVWKDAEVWIDGRFAYRVHDLREGMALSPGVHRIVIRHDLYHDRYVELELEPRQRRVLEVCLAEILP